MTEHEATTITVERRPVHGTSAARKLRREGMVPGIVYGDGKEATPVVLDEPTLKELLKLRASGKRVFMLKVAGTKQEKQTMVKEMQMDPFTQKPLHIDFIRLTAGHKITISVPVHLFGDCEGVKAGGRLAAITREVKLEVLPSAIIDRIDIDVTTLQVGKHLEVKDLQSLVPEGAKFLDEPTRVVVMVETPKAAVEEEVAKPAEAAAEGPTEPELVKQKGKAEEEPEE